MNNATGPYKTKHAEAVRERVLFIGTQFSNLYTAVDTPVRGRVDDKSVILVKVWKFPLRGVSTGLISQGYWENNKWYFVNLERGNIPDQLQSRNINVSFTKNSNNVAIDLLIFTFYSDQLVK